MVSLQLGRSPFIAVPALVRESGDVLVGHPGQFRKCREIVIRTPRAEDDTGGLVPNVRPLLSEGQLNFEHNADLFVASEPGRLRVTSERFAVSGWDL